MYKISKLFLFLTTITTALKASSFGDSSNINNFLYITSFILIIAFAIYIFYKFFSKKQDNKSYISGQKSVDENLYLNDIIESAVKEYNVLSSCHIKDKNVIEKEIVDKLTEASIYLNTITNSIESKVENFNLEEFIKEIHDSLYDKANDKEFNIVTNSNLAYSIIADKTILKDIFTLLALLQFKEHNLKNASANIELFKKDNILLIKVSQGLDYNKHIQRALNNNLNPIYDKEQKKYYGIYLYLINRLVNKINGVLKIDILKTMYTVQITIPVNIEHLENKANLILPKEFKTEKKALIICEDNNLSQSIENFLKLYNISSETISDEKIVQMPNFTDYDILISNSSLLLSMLSDYLLSIKSRNNLKIVSIEAKGKEYKYQRDLVDFKLQKPILQSSVYQMILHIYHNEIIKQYSSSNKAIEKAKNNSSLLSSKFFKSRKRKKHNRVLVADDDRVNRHLLTKMIEQFNIEVVEAVDGEDALNILNREKNFDLVILDSIMPKLDAYELIEKIRANQEFNSIPVIIHSSFSMRDQSIDTIFKLGFDSYLPKPFNMEKLQSILQRYLQISNKALKKNKSDIKKHYEEFIAIYANSDRLLEKFVSENQTSQLTSLLRDLKNISIKIDETKLTEAIIDVEEQIKNGAVLNSDLIYNLIEQIKESKNYILSKLA